MTYSQKLKDPRWQKKRLEILNRDEFTCRICGDSESTLNVHHVCYNGEPWEADSEMLLTLCEGCHKEESDFLKRYQREAINELKQNGFMSLGFGMLPDIFKKDRGWMFDEFSFAFTTP